MSSAKEAALDLIQRMPDEASIETILAELHLLARIERGLAEMRQGKTVDHEEAKQRFDKWLG